MNHPPVETVLVVDDEPAQRRLAEYTLSERLGYRAMVAASGQEALDHVFSQRAPVPDLVLIDLVMPGMDGLEVIRTLRSMHPQLPVIVLTQYGDDDNARRAIAAGACDFLTKPVMVERLRLSIHHALCVRRMVQEIACLQRRCEDDVRWSDVIGESPAVRQAVDAARLAASDDAPLWLQGERGTGKEWLARAVHAEGPRAAGSPVSVDCRVLGERAGALLLGGRRADGQFIAGKLKQADRGTLILKHVDALPPAIRQRVFEAAQEKRLRPHGSDAAIHADFRLICTLRAAAPSFRASLPRALQGRLIALPPLDERKGDLAILAAYFLQRYAAQDGKYIRDLEPAALEDLGRMRWPDHVRQLSGLIWRAVMLCDGDTLEARTLRAARLAAPHAAPGETGPSVIDPQGRIRALKVIEEEAIRLALHHAGGSMTRAARGLGIGRSTLYRRIEEMKRRSYSERASQTTRPMMDRSSSGHS